MRRHLRAPLRPMRLLWAAVSTLAMCGCAATGGYASLSGSAPQRTARTGQQAQREAALGARWKGQSHEALVKSLGPPGLVMTVPGERPLPTLVLMYGVQDPAAACVDAFTVVRNKDSGQWSVADYFCR